MESVPVTKEKKIARMICRVQEHFDDGSRWRSWTDKIVVEHFHFIFFSL